MWNCYSELWSYEFLKLSTKSVSNIILSILSNSQLLFTSPTLPSFFSFSVFIYLHISSPTRLCRLVINLSPPLPHSYFYLLSFIAVWHSFSLPSSLHHKKINWQLSLHQLTHTQTRLSHQPFFINAALIPALLSLTYPCVVCVDAEVTADINNPFKFTSTKPHGPSGRSHLGSYSYTD